VKVWSEEGGMSPKRLHPVEVNKQQDLNLTTQDIKGAKVTNRLLSSCRSLL
jgi:hypothetical protein